MSEQRLITKVYAHDQEPVIVIDRKWPSGSRDWIYLSPEAAEALADDLAFAVNAFRAKEAECGKKEST